MFMLTAVQLNILVTLTGAESAEDVAEQVRVRVLYGGMSRIWPRELRTETLRSGSAEWK